MSRTRKDRMKRINREVVEAKERRHAEIDLLGPRVILNDGNHGDTIDASEVGIMGLLGMVAGKALAKRTGRRIRGRR